MPGLNYFVGRIISDLKVSLINLNYKLVRFIPNGRNLALDIKRSREPINTIFDVGANVGQTCLLFTKAFPSSVIYSFEPVSATYQQLVINAQKHSNIVCVNLALGDKKEDVYIVQHENTETNSLKDITEKNDNNAIAIKVDTGANFIKNNGIASIDLLKIDTEGFEMEVLKGFENGFLKHNVKFIYVETGFDRSDAEKTHYSAIEQYLSETGFVTTGFYEPFFWGKGKLRLGFCNVLFTNIKLIGVD